VKPLDVILRSAEASAGLVGTREFLSFTKNTLQFTAQELAEHVTADDQPCLLVPMELSVDGKFRQGAVLALDGRAVIAWATGGIRLTLHSTTIPLAELVAVDTRSEAARGIRTGREKLILRTSTATWEMQLPTPVFEGGRNIMPFVGPALHGAITPEFEAAPPT
jgi:hypothetical protein